MKGENGKKILHVYVYLPIFILYVTVFEKWLK